MYSERVTASKEKKKISRKRSILTDLNMLENSTEVHPKPCHNSSSSDSSECEDEPVVKRQRKTTRRVIDPTQILSSDHSQSNVYTTIAKKSFEELHSSTFDFSKYCNPESDKINTEKQKSTDLQKNSKSELQGCNDNDVVCLDSDCGTPEPQENASGLSQSPAPPSPPPPVVTKPIRTRSFTKITKHLNKIQSSIQKLDKVLNSNSEDCQSLDNSVIIVDDEDGDDDDDDGTIDSSLDNLSREIVVMVKIGSEIIRFEMNKMDMFCNLFSFLSKEKKVSENRLMLLLNEKTIHQNETPASIKLQVADIINCLITQEEDDEDEEEEQISERTGPNVISLVLQNSINQKSKKIMKIGKFEPLQGIIDLYAKQHNLQAADLKLRFDGEIVNSSQTPNDLDMEDEDCIDLIMI